MLPLDEKDKKCWMESAGRRGDRELGCGHARQAAGYVSAVQRRDWTHTWELPAWRQMTVRGVGLDH